MINPHLYALIAGEPSGDNLGAGLMMALKHHDPAAEFIGIGGPRMIHLGMHSYARMEDLAVMGFTEVFSRLLPILRIRTKITKTIINAAPAVLVGIDLPDFNLAVEARVRRAGIPVVHYVSPSVWAWRESRMRKIRQACDLVLALLEFEKKYYDKENMPCEYVGHALANAIPLDVDTELARERIDLFRSCVEPVTGKVMGIMPGSRAGVIERMLPIYAQAARLIKNSLKQVCFISSVPTYELAAKVKDIWLENAPDLSLTLYVGSSLDVMASCDAVLLTSGTVALEAMLLKRPFCVAYKVSPVSAAVGRRLIKIRTFSLPNLIAGKDIVKEFIQDTCTPANLSAEMIKLMTSSNLLMEQQFRNIHESMRLNSDELAARAVLRVMEQVQERSVRVKQVPDGSAKGFKNEIEPDVTLPDASEVHVPGEKTEPRFGPGGDLH